MLFIFSNHIGWFCFFIVLFPIHRITVCQQCDPFDWLKLWNNNVRITPNHNEENIPWIGVGSNIRCKCIHKIFTDCNQVEIVYKNENKLSNLLGSTKYRTPNVNKSGECGRKYYGQTKRSIEVKFKVCCFFLSFSVFVCFECRRASTSLLIPLHYHQTIDADTLVPKCIQVSSVNTPIVETSFESFYLRVTNYIARIVFFQ